MFPGQDQEGVSLNEMKKDEENEKRDLNDEYDNYDDLMFVDPRCARLGMRIIIHKDGKYFIFLHTNIL